MSSSSAPTKRVFLFDIDGTLLISDGAGSSSWTLAFEELYQISADIFQYTDTGMTDQAIAKHTFEATMKRPATDAELKELIEVRLRHLRETINASAHFEVLSGVFELLTKLKASGAILGVVTGNLQEAAEMKLEKASLADFFTFGGYGSDAFERVDLTQNAIDRCRNIHGFDLPLEDFVAIGDTPNDIKAAHGCAIQCVGVGTHKYKREELAAAGADFAIENLKDGLPMFGIDL
ncbi:MAG: HAD family hydrolase [Actinomycetota bacterium]|nr:HAD family hydrolase [Actinomycetota bacterium]